MAYELGWENVWRVCEKLELRSKKSFDGLEVLEVHGFNTIVSVIVSPIFYMNREN